jgi:hypothetical protein
LAHACLWSCHTAAKLEFITANLVEATNEPPIFNAWMRRRNPQFSASKMEMTMPKIALTVLVVPLIAALSAEAAAAAEHHHRHTIGRPMPTEQIRNSNAYAAPGNIAVQTDFQDLDEGAMTSGLAGH